MKWQATALGPNDNVAIALASIAAGEDVVVNVGGRIRTIRALEPIALNHKLALADLRAGDAVIKYGEAIGEATADIARGAWVHVHNLRSRRARHDNGARGAVDPGLQADPAAAPGAFDSGAYLEAAAAALELPVPPSSRAAVAANLSRLHALAHEVLEFDLPASDRASSSEST